MVVCAVGGAVWVWGTEGDGPRAHGSAPSAPPAATPLVSAPDLELSPAPNVDDRPAALHDSAPPEREYLDQLSALHHTDKQAALTWAEKGEEWYSDVGRYAEARRAMRVTLLVDLNRMDEARAFTREFIAKYPDSPYRRLVSGVTGIHPRPSGPRTPAAHAVTSTP